MTKKYNISGHFVSCVDGLHLFLDEFKLNAEYEIKPLILSKIQKFIWDFYLIIFDKIQPYYLLYYTLIKQQKFSARTDLRQRISVFVERKI